MTSKDHPVEPLNGWKPRITPATPRGRASCYPSSALCDLPWLLSPRAEADKTEGFARPVLPTSGSGANCLMTPARCAVQSGPGRVLVPLLSSRGTSGPQSQSLWGPHRVWMCSSRSVMARDHSGNQQTPPHRLSQQRESGETLVPVLYTPNLPIPGWDSATKATLGHYPPHPRPWPSVLFPAEALSWESRRLVPL